MAQVKRLTGTVKWFNGQKGFGFITPDYGGEDLFVHQTSIRSEGFRVLAEGDAVEFAVDRGDDGRTKAVDVTGRDGSAIAGRGFSSGRGFRGGGYGGGYGRMGGRGGRMTGSGGFVGGGYGGGYAGGGRGYGGGAECFNCGRTGHLARDCYQGRGGLGGGGRGGRFGGGGGGYSGGGGGCYNCGERGHLARDCPNAEQ